MASVAVAPDLCELAQSSYVIEREPKPIASDCEFYVPYFCIPPFIALFQTAN